MLSSDTVNYKRGTNNQERFVKEIGGRLLTCIVCKWPYIEVYNMFIIKCYKTKFVSYDDLKQQMYKLLK